MTDYMATDHEMQKQPDALEFMRQAANGDAFVFDAMWSFWNFAHVWDDLIDGSSWDMEKKEQAFKALHDFVIGLLVNPFVLRYASEVRAMLTSAMSRCLEGDRMAASDNPREKELSSAVRCADIDVLMHYAYLHCGWTTMREFSKKRRYDE